MINKNLRKELISNKLYHSRYNENLEVSFTIIFFFYGIVLNQCQKFN